METVRVAQQCHPSLGSLAQVRSTLRAQGHVPGRDNVLSLIHDFVACIDIRKIALPSLRWRINPPEAEFVPTFDDTRQTQCVVGHQFVAVSHTDSIGLMTCQRTEGQRASQKAVGDGSAVSCANARIVAAVTARVPTPFEFDSIFGPLCCALTHPKGTATIRQRSRLATRVTAPAPLLPWIDPMT